jgi:hypothetical protein
MNAGFSHSAEISPSGFHFAFDIVAMGALVSDDQKTYIAPAPPTFGELKTATVFGDKAGVATSTVDPSLQYKGIADGVINTSLFPLAAPQVTIGNIYGTQATVRFITVASSTTKKLGTVTLVGGGLRHSISQYLPDFPLDLAGGVFYTRFSVGDVISFNSIAIGAQASKKLSVLVLHGGLQYENSTMELQYTSSNPAAPGASVDIKLDGANKFRFTVGAGLDFAIVHIFADANVGSVTNFTAGIGFGGY